MAQNESKLIDDILNTENPKEAVDLINTITNKELLHKIAMWYNWDMGFDIPNAIITNHYCDLGTAVMIFYLADGFCYFDDVALNSGSKTWSEFLRLLYKRISRQDFFTEDIASEPQISKAQVFKLKKSNPDIPTALLEKRNGVVISYA